MGQFNLLRIEIDGHFHGSSQVPRPWVAEITGPDPKFGLAREFLDPMNDWSEARKAWSGNVYGRVAQFALRDGRLYEVCRPKGKSSKRYMAREFLLVDGGKRTVIEPEEALARVDGGGDAYTLEIPDDRDGTSWVARINGLGSPVRLGFVIVGSSRVYRCKDGLFEVVRHGEQSFVSVTDQQPTELTEREALEYLLCRSTSSAA